MLLLFIIRLEVAPVRTAIYLIKIKANLIIITEIINELCVIIYIAR